MKRHRSSGWLYVVALALVAAMLWTILALIPRPCCCDRSVAVDPVTHDVPEPGTLALAGVGVALVLVCKRRNT